MNAWDPSHRMLAIYRVRSGLDDASAAFDAGITDTVTPRIGTPVEVAILFFFSGMFTNRRILDPKI